jgi:hypothetical protein
MIGTPSRNARFWTPGQVAGKESGWHCDTFVLPGPNDIEFSGERKRVRCNEVLGTAYGPCARRPRRETRKPNTGGALRRKPHVTMTKGQPSGLRMRGKN